MTYSAIEIEIKAAKVWVEDRTICIRLEDEREIRFPASENRRLAKADIEDLRKVELICNGTGLHWENLDEDLSVPGIIRGRFGLEKEN